MGEIGTPPLIPSHFTKQHFVSLPDAYPLPPLAPDSIRIVSRLISVTSNNFTYARLGHLIGWWDFARISAWGYAAVRESTHPGVPVGTHLYRYVPIGTLPEVLHIAPTEVVSHWVERGPRTTPPSPTPSSYSSRPPARPPWRSRTSSGTRAPPAAAPQRVIGVGSASSRAFTRGTRLFDDVLLYDDFAARDLAQRLGLSDSKNTKIILVEFGARGEAALSWFRALQTLSPTPTQTRAVIVGSDPAALTSDPTSGVVQLSVDVLRAGAMRADGAARYFSALEAAWTAFKTRDGGAIKGVGVKWGEGMEAVREGWDGLAGGVYGPEVGLVFEL
ncbi:hypothetical protein B0H11DRAFT_2242859 [Mycena galericulata]|nr:hypothetical protein B0H11DRAFT_2242859 [Mycena galericulata]